METFFYGIGLLIIILNIVILLNHNIIFDTADFIFKYRKITGNKPCIKDFKGNFSYELMLFWSSTVIFSTTWIVIGLFTNNWLIFLCMIIGNIFFNKLSMIFKKIYKLRKLLMFLKCFIITTIISALIITHFSRLLFNH